MQEKVYGGDGVTYTIKVEYAGYAFATQSFVYVGRKKIWESKLYPYGANDAAFRAAASQIEEIAGSYRYIGVN